MKNKTFRNAKPEISIIIPAYNEASAIWETLERVSSYLDKNHPSYEIILVCDGCSDNTAEIAGEFAKTNHRTHIIDRKTNMGKGFSVREGCLAAKGEYVFFSDADLSTPIDEIEKLLDALNNGYSVAIGSRALKESDIQVRQAWYREGMGKVFNLFVRAIAVKGIRDTQCGFKGFTKKAAMNIFSRQTISGFGFDVEVLYIANRLGYSIKEIPIRWANREASRVNPLLHPAQMLYELVRIRLKGRMGIYDV